MRATAETQGDRTASVTPAIRASMPWRVEAVTALPDYRLSVRFMDGLVGTVDMSALVRSSSSGVFARLRDRALFEQVYLAHGAVMWPGELDIAPDAMHAAIRRHGEWRLG